MGDIIEFDRAEYGPEAPAAAPCSGCKRAMGGEYWTFRSSPVCGACRGAIEASIARATSNASLGRAVLRGAGVALACGVGYAIFVAVTRLQIALITIGIAFLVAKVVRKASGGIGGRRFQLLAVALTYLASAMGYLPGILRAAFEGGVEVKQPFKLAAIVFGYALAAPFLELRQAPLGLLIVGFGLWEAWKLTREVPVAFEGPFRIAPAAQGTQLPAAPPS
jgi:hypothetical protein